MTLSTVTKFLVNNTSLFYNRILFPNACVLCDSLTRRSLALCLHCEKDLPWIKQGCLSCGIPFVSSTTLLHCGQCIIDPPPFTKTVALFHYQQPVSHLISGMKFSNRLLYCKILGELMADRLMQEYESLDRPEIIIPVPLHRNRLRERGYNQAIEIARPIAKRLKIPIDFQSCHRIRHTQPQSKIPANERQKNLHRAFSLTRNRDYHSIALVDDVMTTGNTLKELAQAFQNVGVKEIQVWCCARTNLDR